MFGRRPGPAQRRPRIRPQPRELRDQSAEAHVILHLQDWQAAIKERVMPEKRTVEKARKARRAGKSPTTQAGEFVREEIHKIRRGEHGARSPEQAIAIG